jgi:hypothetical protein
MKRGAIVAAWVLVALAQPAGARALALALPRMPTEPGAPQGMCEVPALLAHAPASSNVELAAPVELQPEAPQTPIDDSPIAWCATPDDPRCSSRDAGSLPDSSRVQAQLSSASGIELPALRVREVMQLFEAEQLGAALAGQHLRVERPPRSSRRCG